MRGVKPFSRIPKTVSGKAAINRAMATPSIALAHQDIEVLGYSLAGEETYFVLPRHNIGFDFGRCPRDVLTVDHVFLSHGHTDHAAGLAYYFSQRMFIDNAPGNAYVPAPLVEPLRELLALWGDIDGHRPPGQIIAAEPEQEIEVRRDLFVRPFAVNHQCRSRGQRFAALGFAAVEVRKKLKEEYQGLMGPQIVELKQRGVEIERRVEMPLVTYCGDTGPGAFFDRDDVRQAQVLLLECTFIEAEHRERARAGNHLHIEHLREIVPQLNNELIVLTHLTRRTHVSDARAALERTLPASELERVKFLAEFRPRRRPRPR